MQETKNNINSVVFNQAKKYLQNGISVIPVRDKDVEINGKLLKRKEPFKGWKKYQTERIAESELYNDLERFDTTAIATVCGKVSGNLIVPDFDSKWKPGIEILVLNELRNINPELAGKLRKIKTPSGGEHWPLRIIDHDVPGGEKLASRPSTEDELAKNPKEKIKCFIETRGDGQYAVAYPSPGYTVIQDNPIPEITWDEFCNLRNIFKLFTEIVGEEKKLFVSKSDGEYYSINPFEDFNKSVEGGNVLTANGWTFCSENANHHYFTKPGGTKGTIHATFMKRSRLYRNFTTNSEIPSDTNYTPSTIKAILEYGGGKKKLYRELVQKGYGKIIPQVEEKIVKSAALNNTALPPNISQAAKESYGELVNQRIIAHPYGICWEVSGTGKVSISRTDVYGIAVGLGFGLLDGQLVRVIGRLIHKKEKNDLFNSFREYVKEEDGILYKKICDALENFFQEKGEFTLTRLNNIPEDKILVDTKEECYKFYNNGVLKIKEGGISLVNYDSVGDKYILADLCQDRDYIEYVEGQPKGKYVDYLNKAILYDDLDRKEYINKIIGYLADGFKDETTANIIVLTEMVPDPDKGGGSGKNLFGNLFRLTTTVHAEAGAQVQLNKDLLQAWQGQKIFAGNDVPKDFRYSYFKNLSSNGGQEKKLFKNLRSVPIEKMPKFLFDTNHSYYGTEGGMGRRFIQLEFTDFFTKCKGVNVHYGCYFPTGWDQIDWIGYDYTISRAIQIWIRCGRQLENKELSDTGWQKQFDQKYGEETRIYFNDQWPIWITNENRHPKNGYHFISERLFDKTYIIFCKDKRVRNPKTTQVLNKALEEFCKNKGVKYIYYKTEDGKDVKDSFRIGGQQRSKRFLNAAPIKDESELAKT